MIRMLITSFLVLVQASLCFGQTVAKITGPTLVLPGELAVLSSAESVGDNHKWITPEQLSTAQAGCDAIASQIFFATPKIGEYTFILVVTDKQANIEFAKHTVQVRNLTPPVDPPPVTPPPVTPPTTDFGKLKELSMNNSKRLNDPTTRAALANNLKTAIADLKNQCAAGQCPTLDGAKERLVQVIGSTLLLRTGKSRDVHWEEAWRVPNNQFLALLKITQVPVYLDAMAALAAGLE